VVLCDKTTVVWDARVLTVATATTSAIEAVEGQPDQPPAAVERLRDFAAMIDGCEHGGLSLPVLDVGISPQKRF
jgi:hypothetical protein